MRRSVARLALPLVTVFCLACGGGDSGGSPTAPGGNGDDREIKQDPSFASDIQEIFARRGCTASNCHGAALSGGMDLRTNAAFASLVGVPSQGETGIRVIPGDPQNSYLVIKLEGRQSFGARMPLTGSVLDNIDITNIRNWITQGAKQN